MRSRWLCAVLVTVVGIAASACQAPTSPPVSAAWTPVSGVPPAYVQAGDCPAVNVCVGVQGTVDRVDALQWNGTTWTTLARPAGWLLMAVSCPDTQTCYLAGTQPGPGAPIAGRPLLVRWDGQSLTEVPADFGGTETVAQALSCPTVSTCLVRLAKPAGSPTSGGAAGRMVRVDGATAIPIGGPLGATFTSGLGLLSCGAPDLCAAGASYMGTPGVARWDGLHWTYAAVVSSTGGRTDLRQLSCTGSTFCAVVGSDSRGTGGSRRVTTVVATWQDASWSSLAPLARPAGEPDPPLDVVQMLSCGSPTWCVAVGGEYADETDGTITPLTLVWTGSGWHRGPPRPAERSMTGFIDCVPGQRWCLAAGTYGAADVFAATG
jgi:hypothetical protein